MKSFDDEMIQIRNELLNLKSYMTKKTSVFRTEEYSITVQVKLDNDIFPDLASGAYFTHYKTENGATALATAYTTKSFLDGIYRTDLKFTPGDSSDDYEIYVFISTTDQGIIDRLNNGETVIVDVPIYVVTTGTFLGME